MARPHYGGDLTPDRSLADAMTHVHGGLGSVAVAVRIALAVTAAWLLAGMVSQSNLTVFAPMTTLLVVQASPSNTIGLSIQRVLGTGLGVLLSTVWVNFTGVHWWSYLSAILVSLLIAQRLRWSVIGQLQIPVAVAFVLAIGPGDHLQAVWRVLDVIAGGLVAIAAVTIYPPKPDRSSFEAAMSRLRNESLRVLRLVGEESGSHAAALPADELHQYAVASRSLRDSGDATLAEFNQLVGHAQWNYRASEFRRSLPADNWRLRRLIAFGMQVRSFASAANALYDRGLQPALRSADLQSLLMQLEALSDLAVGAGTAPVVATDLVAMTAADARLAAAIRERTDAITAEAAVSQVLESVSLLGRLDLLRSMIVRLGAGYAGVDDSDSI